jgi:hypothetical protein
MLYRLADIIDKKVGDWEASLKVVEILEDADGEFNNTGEVYSAAICTKNAIFKDFVLEYGSAHEASKTKIQGYTIPEYVSEGMKKTILEKYVSKFKERGENA